MSRYNNHKKALSRAEKQFKESGAFYITQHCESQVQRARVLRRLT